MKPYAIRAAGFLVAAVLAYVAIRFVLAPVSVPPELEVVSRALALGAGVFGAVEVAYRYRE